MWFKYWIIFVNVSCHCKSIPGALFHLDLWSTFYKKISSCLSPQIVLCYFVTKSNGSCRTIEVVSVWPDYIKVIPYVNSINNRFLEVLVFAVRYAILKLYIACYCKMLLFDDRIAWNFRSCYTGLLPLRLLTVSKCSKMYGYIFMHSMVGRLSCHEPNCLSWSCVFLSTCICFNCHMFSLCYFKCNSVISRIS
jgi:hypothetical protein